METVFSEGVQAVPCVELTHGLQAGFLKSAGRRAPRVTGEGGLEGNQATPDRLVPRALRLLPSSWGAPRSFHAVTAGAGACSPQAGSGRFRRGVRKV